MDRIELGAAKLTVGAKAACRQHHSVAEWRGRVETAGVVQAPAAVNVPVLELYSSTWLINRCSQSRPQAAPTHCLAASPCEGSSHGIVQLTSANGP